MAEYTQSCHSCGEPITAALFGTLGSGGSMLSSIPTDRSLREHPTCDVVSSPGASS